MLQLKLDLTSGRLALNVAERLSPEERLLLQDKVAQARASEDAHPDKGYPDPGGTAGVLAYLIGRCLRAIQTRDVNVIIAPVAAICQMTPFDLTAQLPEPK